MAGLAAVRRSKSERQSSSTVRFFTQADAARWDDFVERHESGTFYHLSAWKTLIERQLGHKTFFLMSESRGEVNGVLPLAQVRSWLFGNALISMPFLVYGGPLADNNDALQSLVGAARKLAEDLDVDYLELRNRAPLDGDWHTKTTAVTFRKQLQPEPEANLMAIPRKQRAMIRKGIDAGLEAETDDGTERLYRALLECKRNLGTPFFSESWLRSIKGSFGKNAEILTVTRKGQVVCSVMSFRFRKEVLPYYGGGGDLARKFKGNDFMYWAVMEKSCREGVELFDYGRSTVGTGAYRFKKHWGFEPETLHYQYHLVRAEEVPKLNPSNPRYRFLIEAWKRLPLPLAGFLGPPIAGRLG